MHNYYRADLLSHHEVLRAKLEELLILSKEELAEKVLKLEVENAKLSKKASDYDWEIASRNGWLMDGR